MDVREAAEQGDASSQFTLGLMYANGEGVSQNDVEAVAWFRRAAEQGYEVAQRTCGQMYFQGRGAPQDDAEAAAWFRKAAEQGDPMSQFNLGVMYDEGRTLNSSATEGRRTTESVTGRWKRGIDNRWRS